MRPTGCRAACLGRRPKARGTTEPQASAPLRRTPPAALGRPLPTSTPGPYVGGSPAGSRDTASSQLNGLAYAGVVIAVQCQQCGHSAAEQHPQQDAQQQPSPCQRQRPKTGNEVARHCPAASATCAKQLKRPPRTFLHMPTRAKSWPITVADIARRQKANPSAPHRTKERRT